MAKFHQGPSFEQTISEYSKHLSFPILSLSTLLQSYQKFEKEKISDVSLMIDFKAIQLLQFRTDGAIFTQYMLNAEERHSVSPRLP